MKTNCNRCKKKTSSIWHKNSDFKILWFVLRYRACTKCHYPKSTLIECIQWHIFTVYWYLKYRLWAKNFRLGRCPNCRKILYCKGIDCYVTYNHNFGCEGKYIVPDKACTKIFCKRCGLILIDDSRDAPCGIESEKCKERLTAKFLWNYKKNCYECLKAHELPEFYNDKYL
jgi:hypothetical protein